MMHTTSPFSQWAMGKPLWEAILFLSPVSTYLRLQSFAASYASSWCSAEEIGTSSPLSQLLYLRHLRYSMDLSVLSR